MAENLNRLRHSTRGNEDGTCACRSVLASKDKGVNEQHTIDMIM